ncbi:Vacuolar protein sorting-associated protein 11 [Thoreauomyces humboldtii]|nr:Vacuolar protein sorting-associated protein 11 [Thoreauomyces humboldtii]
MVVVFSFQAHERHVTHMKHMKHQNQLVSVGEDASGIPVVKVWNLDKKTDKNADTPVLQRSSKIQYGQKVFPVTALAVMENMTQVAIGLENGVVVLIRGDISRDRFTKSKIIHEGSEMVTGLGFYEDGKRTVLYIVTLARVLTCDTSNKDQKRILEETGGEVDTVLLTPQDTHQEIVIGRNEAVYFYGLDGRGPCCSIDGQKTRLIWFRNYLAIVSRETVNTAERHSALADLVVDDENSSVIEAPPSENSPGTVLTLYDLKNKFVAYNGTFMGSGYKPQPIKAVLAEWGELLVVTADHKMYRLQEKDMDTKLEILYKKNMYTLAISLLSTTPASVSSTIEAESLVRATGAPSGEYDYGTLVEIYKRYGDWLYGKTEFDSAIQQYLQTIGHLEPSYVIRKFLDAQRIHNLTSYLQALHEQGLANADHTTLLLNCYTKLKDVKRLDEFIKTDKEIKFDVETAIRVCRQGGYFDHALWLTKKFHEDEWYLRIQVEDLKHYDDAVKFLAGLKPREAIRALTRYGYVLVTEKPAEMTNVLLKLCTEPTDEGRSSAWPEDFLHLYVNRTEWCVKFLEQLLKKRWNVSIGGKGKEPQQPPGGTAATPSTNLESDREKQSRSTVCSTLLELYLGGGQGSIAGIAEQDPSFIAVPEATRKRWRTNADLLLHDQNANYDINHALVLCKMHEFGSGILYLYERMSLHKDILQQHMDASDYTNVISTCKAYGDADPSLWTQSLAFFAEKGTGLGGPNPQAELLMVLDTIDKKNLLPPLQVVQILARNSTVTIGMVKDYIIRRVEAERRNISESQKLIVSYRDETLKMKEQIEELQTKPLIFQVTKCEICRQPLELPTVYFLCKHSYHQRCLGDADGECPRCAPEHRMIQDLVRSQESNAGRHDVFMNKLESTDDRFGLIAEWFSKNAFSTVRLAD